VSVVDARPAREVPAHLLGVATELDEVPTRTFGLNSGFRDHDAKLSRQIVSVNTICIEVAVAYTGIVPKLWTDTIDAHRREVREAILDTTMALAAQHGLLSVTMSQIAERTGIGRATLYKYFPDVQSVVLAWHDRQVSNHLELLLQVRDQAKGHEKRLEAVLTAYAHIHQQRAMHLRHHDHGTELATFLHRDEHIAGAQKHVHDLVRDLLTDVAAKGGVRDDVPVDELAAYCVHALDAAGDLHSKAAVHRLVAVVLAGVRPT
jgi:AcrR family transcriptional regulator